MLGGLLTLAALALGDVPGHRNLASVRNLVFVLVTGASCVVMSGLPEVLFPALPARLLMVLKAGLGPLAGAMALYYLGNWLGGAREDAQVHRLTAWGGAAVLVAALVLAVLGSLVAPDNFRTLLMAAAAVNMVPVLLALVAVIRSARRGDPLARWMVLAVACLAAMVIGMYLRGLEVPGFGLGTWLLTAVVTVTFFLISTVLVLLRNRASRQLARLSRLHRELEPATGLPTGSALLAQIEHAFWRTAHLHGECTVVCLLLSNLYELAESAGPGLEHQILVTMAARIRRAAGFRCVVGLYHPRCFVVVISSDKHDAPVADTIRRLRAVGNEPLTVVGEQQAQHSFRPHMGMGVVTHAPTHARPMDVLNDAERQALATVRGPAGHIAEHDIETAPAALA